MSVVPAKLGMPLQGNGGGTSRSIEVPVLGGTKAALSHPAFTLATADALPATSGAASAEAGGLAEESDVELAIPGVETTTSHVDNRPTDANEELAQPATNFRWIEAEELPAERRSNLVDSDERDLVSGDEATGLTLKTIPVSTKETAGDRNIPEKVQNNADSGMNLFALPVSEGLHEGSRVSVQQEETLISRPIRNYPENLSETRQALPISGDGIRSTASSTTQNANVYSIPADIPHQQPTSHAQWNHTHLADTGDRASRAEQVSQPDPIEISTLHKLESQRNLDGYTEATLSGAIHRAWREDPTKDLKVQAHLSSMAPLSQRSHEPATDVMRLPLSGLSANATDLSALEDHATEL